MTRLARNGWSTADGGDPTYVEQQQEAVHAFGPIFVQLFGQGECPMCLTSVSKEEHLTAGDPVKQRRLGWPRDHRGARPGGG